MNGGNFFVGVDPSATSTGVAIVEIADNFKPVLRASTCIKATTSTGICRSAEIGHLVAEYIATVQGTIDVAPIIAIEGYSYGSKFQLPLLVEVGTLIRYRFHSSGWEAWVVPPTCLKKFVTGKGNTKGKGPLMIAAYKAWGFDLSQDDECDAACLAMMAAAHSGTWKMTAQYQREAVGLMRRI